jgi:hypothetical protein
MKYLSLEILSWALHGQEYKRIPQGMLTQWIRVTAGRRP